MITANSNAIKGAQAADAAARDCLVRAQAFYMLSGIPISVYGVRENKIVSCTDSRAEAFARHNCIVRSLKEGTSVTAVSKVCGLNYGRIACGDYVLIVGPVAGHAIDGEEAERLARGCECVSSCCTASAEEYFRNVPVLPDAVFEGFVKTLCYALGAAAAEREEHAEGDYLSECIAYIDENLCNEKLTLEGAAAHCGYNPSYLSRKFKREYGENFNKYVMRRKLERGAEYLKDTDKTLAEISSDLYFSSQSHFQNMFKSFYGVTPLNYRQNVRGGYDLISYNLAHILFRYKFKKEVRSARQFCRALRALCAR